MIRVFEFRIKCGFRKKRVSFPWAGGIQWIFRGIQLIFNVYTIKTTLFNLWLSRDFKLCKVQDGILIYLPLTNMTRCLTHNPGATRQGTERGLRMDHAALR